MQFIDPTIDDALMRYRDITTDPLHDTDRLQMVPSCRSMITNRVELDDLDADIRNAADEIYDILAQHCGPNAYYAIQPQQAAGRVKPVDVATMDGIGIVNWLKVRDDEPVGEYVLRQVAYMGERVDSICHDGTTTTMMLTAYLMRHLRSKHPPRVMKPAIHKVLADLRKRLDAVTFTVDSFVESVAETIDVKVESQGRTHAAPLHDETTTTIRRALIWNQASIASKGDTELADAIVEVMERLPPEIFGQYAIADHKVETEKRWIVKRQEYDFEFDGESFPYDRNHKSLSQVLCDVCDLYVTENFLVAGSPESAWVGEMVRTIIAKEIAFERDLVIISPKFDEGFVEGVRRFNFSQGRSAPRIILLRQSVGLNDHRNMVLRAVRASAGVGDFFQVPSDQRNTLFIRGAKVWQAYHRIHITNLYPRDGGAYHPSYRTPGTDRHYDALRTEIVDTLRDAQNGHHAAEYDSGFVADLVRVYHQLVCQNPVTLEIGGTTHEHTANHSVARDALGAVVSMLEHGFVFGGLRHLMQADLRYDNDKVADWVWNTIRLGLLDIHDAVYYGYHNRGTVVPDAQRYGYTNPDDPGNRAEYYYLTTDGDVECENAVDVFTDESYSSMSRVLIQPVAGYRELLRRLGEQLPQMTAASALMNPHV